MAGLAEALATVGVTNLIGVTGTLLRALTAIRAFRAG